MTPEDAPHPEAFFSHAISPELLVAAIFPSVRDRLERWGSALHLSPQVLALKLGAHYRDIPEDSSVRRLVFSGLPVLDTAISAFHRVLQTPWEEDQVTGAYLLEGCERRLESIGTTLPFRCRPKSASTDPRSEGSDRRYILSYFRGLNQDARDQLAIYEIYVGTFGKLEVLATTELPSLLKQSRLLMRGIWNDDDMVERRKTFSSVDPLVRCIQDEGKDVGLSEEYFHQPLDNVRRYLQFYDGQGLQTYAPMTVTEPVDWTPDPLGRPALVKV